MSQSHLGRSVSVTFSPGTLRSAASDGVRLGEVAGQTAAHAHAAVVDAALGVRSARGRVARVDSAARVATLKQPAQLMGNCVVRAARTHTQTDTRWSAQTHSATWRLQNGGVLWQATCRGQS